MKIPTKKYYIGSNGKPFPNIEEWRASEVAALMRKETKNEFSDDQLALVSTVICKNVEDMKTLLTAGEGGRPFKPNKEPRKRRAKADSKQTELPVDSMQQIVDPPTDTVAATTNGPIVTEGTAIETSVPA